MLYEALFRGLHVAHVRYLLVGAVAINLHGVPRMTADLDLMVDMAESNLRTFVQTMITLGYKPRVPVDAAEILDPVKRREWKENKSMNLKTAVEQQRTRSCFENLSANGWAWTSPAGCESVRPERRARRGSRRGAGHPTAVFRMIVCTWLHPARLYEEVDMFLENPIDFGTAYANRKDVVIGDFTIPLAGVSDLIALKSLSDREQDRSDIEALRKIQRLTEEGSG